MKKLQFEDLIVFENDDYVVINKPPHVSTLDDRAPEGKDNINGMAKAYIESAQVCHRLDKETSGILAIAKNPEAYRHMAMQFEKREVTKVYHAVVGGLHEYKEVEVDKPILPNRTGAVKIDINGKPAQTVFNTLKIFKAHTLVEARPVTGRMHQIRIHLAVLKSPIIHDSQYGGKPLFLSSIKKNFKLKKYTDEQPLISRVALHAQALHFKLLNGETQVVKAPYPKDIRALVNQLEKNV